LAENNTNFEINQISDRNLWKIVAKSLKGRTMCKKKSKKKKNEKKKKKGKKGKKDKKSSLKDL